MTTISLQICNHSIFCNHKFLRQFRLQLCNCITTDLFFLDFGSWWWAVAEEFSSDLELVKAVLRLLMMHASYDRVDLSSGWPRCWPRKSRAQSRILQVVRLLACFLCHASHHVLSFYHI